MPNQNERRAPQSTGRIPPAQPKAKKASVAGARKDGGTSGLRAVRGRAVPQGRTGARRAERSAQAAIFAYVDKQGQGHLPLNDEAQVRSAMSHWNLTAFESAAARETARQAIVEAAHHHGIHVLPNRKIARPSVGLPSRR